MKILVTGPESAGKSTLSRQLAWILDGIFVAEAARTYLQGLDRPYQPHDLPRIWHRQCAGETEAVSSGASFVLCDTGPEVIRVWSEVRFGTCDPAVFRATREHRYDLVLLCYPDLPWSPDPLREHPDEADRRDLFERYENLLPDAVHIAGNNRVDQALAALDTALGRTRQLG